MLAVDGKRDAAAAEPERELPAPGARADDALLGAYARAGTLPGRAATGSESGSGSGSESGSESDSDSGSDSASG